MFYIVCNADIDTNNFLLFMCKLVYIYIYIKIGSNWFCNLHTVEIAN
jgi:hypothetical protein